MKRDAAEFSEGPEAAERFGSLLGRVLSVPKEELAKREAAYQKERTKKRAKKPRPRRSGAA